MDHPRLLRYNFFYLNIHLMEAVNKKINLNKLLILIKHVTLIYLIILFITFNLFWSIKNRYLMYTLDKFVEQDYSLVYFHYGLTSKNKPTLSWLWQAYRAFDRKYKKNLKALYLVHPTGFIKVVWQLFRAVIRWNFMK